MIAAGAAAVVAFMRTQSSAGARPSPIPLETIEFAAGAVATVLALLRVVEMVFDFDDLDSYGGVLGAIVTVGLLIAAGAVLAGAFRRDPSLRSDVLASDRGTRLAVVGLVLVVLAWLLNLSIGFWNMNAAATPVALLTFGAVLVVVQRRWLAALEEVPLGWVGAGFGVVGLLLAIGLWGDLMDIGRTRVDLELIDYLPQILSFLGHHRDHRRRGAGRTPDVAGPDQGPAAGRCHTTDDPARTRGRGDAAGRAGRTARAAGRPADAARLNRPGTEVLRPPRAGAAARPSRHTAPRRPRRGSRVPSRPAPVRRGRVRPGRAAARALLR